MNTPSPIATSANKTSQGANRRPALTMVFKHPLVRAGLVHCAASGQHDDGNYYGA